MVQIYMAMDGIEDCVYTYTGFCLNAQQNVWN